MKPVSAFQLASDAKRVAFLRELLHGASASLAAARADLNRGTVYRWKLADREFAALWAEIVASRPRRGSAPESSQSPPGIESSGVQRPIAGVARSPRDLNDLTAVPAPRIDANALSP